MGARVQGVTSRERRILKFEASTGWSATPPKRAGMRVPPIPWSPKACVRDSVALGLTSSGSVAFLHHVSVLRLVQADREITRAIAAEGTLAYQVRRRVVDEFLEDTRLGNWLLMIDAAVVVSPDVARGLITAASNLRLDIASQVCPTRGGECEAALINDTGGADGVEEPAWGTVALVDLLPFGCVMLRRQLLAEMAEAFRGAEGLFDPMPEFPDGVEGFSFCARARGLGARIAIANIVRIRRLETVPLMLSSQSSVPALELEL